MSFRLRQGKETRHEDSGAMGTVRAFPQRSEGPKGKRSITGGHGNLPLRGYTHQLM
ncbi:MAG: hypothetical protein ACOYVK_17660 [Bacillota bacterium]